MIIGCGGLGSNVANQLTRSGVKKLIIVDPDYVTLTNIHRQNLFTEKDAQDKTLKVIAAKRQLNLINSEVEITTIAQPVTAELIQQQQFDLLIDCLDNYTTRKLIKDCALADNFDYIFASCAETFGNAMAISPRQHPCLNCVFTNLTTLAQNDGKVFGNNAPLVNLVASLQVSLAMHYLIDKESLAFDQLITVDNWQLTFNKIKVPKNRTCLSCQKYQFNKEEK